MWRPLVNKKDDFIYPFINEKRKPWSVQVTKIHMQMIKSELIRVKTKDTESYSYQTVGQRDIILSYNHHTLIHWHSTIMPLK